MALSWDAYINAWERVRERNGKTLKNYKSDRQRVLCGLAAAMSLWHQWRINGRWVPPSPPHLFFFIIQHTRTSTAGPHEIVCVYSSLVKKVAWIDNNFFFPTSTLRIQWLDCAGHLFGETNNPRAQNKERKKQQNSQFLEFFFARATVRLVNNIKSCMETLFPCWIYCCIGSLSPTRFHAHVLLSLSLSVWATN